jgi:hypothetical protein
MRTSDRFRRRRVLTRAATGSTLGALALLFAACSSPTPSVSAPTQAPAPLPTAAATLAATAKPAAPAAPAPTSASAAATAAPASAAKVTVMVGDLGSERFDNALSGGGAAEANTANRGRSQSEKA